MLELIDSEFFVKKLMFHLNDKRKLQLIKYNKSFQNKLDINIINYRILSGRYIIYESKVKGKEYNSISDKLVFEGEYLNGQRNGYGKEITVSHNSIVEIINSFKGNNNNLYEGEYLKGKRNGKGKEYMFEKLVFEGEYLDGKRNGKGKEYQDDILIFEGTYLKGKKNGEGKEYYEDGSLKYEGKFLNGFKWEGKGFNMLTGDVLYELKDGKGFIIEYDFSGKLLYEGENINGKGKKYSFGGKLEYEGEYLNGEKNGKGKEYNRYNGNILFEGEYLNGLKWTGKGYNLQNQIAYELKEGRGYIKEYDDVVLIFEGDLLKGKRNGKGKVYNPEDGELLFEGVYLNGEKNGKGKEYDLYGNVIFEGEYVNGMKNGKGKSYYKGELIFDGEYFYEHKIKGKEFHNGKLEYEGEYLFYKKWNGKGYDENGNVIYELNRGNGTVKEFTYDGLVNYEGELKKKKKLRGKEYDYKGNLTFEGEY